MKPWEAEKQLQKISRTRTAEIGLRWTQIEHQDIYIYMNIYEYIDIYMNGGDKTPVAH